ncbi:hypothetical protein BH10PLA1_BH10PLA1_22990 [soil metagenome]
MKVLYSLSILSMLAVGFCSTGCETSHSETDKETMMGGHKHEETTTTKNPITGDVSTSHSEQKTSN